MRAAADFFNSLKFTERELVIAHRILKEIRERLGFLVNVGLDYLTLDRAAATLSGGEGQRIRLATQIGSGLVGVLYILDEPSIGLHQRDNRRLLQTLLRLRDLGNTVVVVEHDAETMMAADHLLDMGPGAGTHGGQIIAQGTPKDVMGNPDSLTGQYLRGTQMVSLPRRQRKAKGLLSIVGATKHNLKGDDSQDSARPAYLCDRRIGVRKEHAGSRSALPFSLPIALSQETQDRRLQGAVGRRRAG